MKLTKKQQEVVDRFLKLEKEYGEGNVFIRWINDFWKYAFIIHKKNEMVYSSHFIQDQSLCIHGKVINSLNKMGILQCQDIHHNKVENLDVALRNGIIVVGSTIQL